MRRMTHPLRVALAILAGTLLTPLYIALLSLVAALLFGSSMGSLWPVAIGDIAGVIVYLWLIGMLVGGPISLAAIALLFCPFWLLHHRGGGSQGSFVAAAATIGLLIGAGLLFLSAEAFDTENLLVLPTFAAAAGLSGWTMWMIAYAGGRRLGVDVRDLPQANFTSV